MGRATFGRGGCSFDGMCIASAGASAKAAGAVRSRLRATFRGPPAGSVGGAKQTPKQRGGPMWTWLKRSIIAVVAVAALVGAAGGAMAAEKKSFKIAWSIYVGWMPWPYAQESGILTKWAEKYGISIDLVQINDYVESINQYTAGAFDGVVVTNMDCLTIPSAGGVDTTSIILGDYSNGNDAVILKSVGILPKKKTLADIAGQKVNLVQLSVSQYLLSRALATVDLKESDVTLVNTSDADIVGAFGTSDVTALVTWNPQVSEILKSRNAQKVFDSSQIPGEIMDMMAVNTATAKDNPN